MVAVSEFESVQRLMVTPTLEPLRSLNVANVWCPLRIEKDPKEEVRDKVASIPLVKINTHAAWKKESSMAATIGVVIRNLEGIFLMCCADRVTCSSALIAEGRAALRGLKMAIQNGFKKVVIESDSKGLVDGVGGKQGTIFPLLMEIRKLSSRFESLEWRWVPRS